MTTYLDSNEDRTPQTIERPDVPPVEPVEPSPVPPETDETTETHVEGDEVKVTTEPDGTQVIEAKDRA